MNKSKLSLWLRKLHLLAAAEQLRFMIHRSRYRKKNELFKKQHPDILFPPDFLIYETYKLNLEEYYTDGKETAAEIITLIEKGVNITAPGSRILDWGCGPGRIARHLPGLLPQAAIFATDYNEEYVKWCTDNLKGINCSLNSIHPPLKYADSFFDAIIGISIFTHLSVQNHFNWINEINRIIKPGGVAYITTQGLSYYSKLLTTEQQQFDKGELVTREAIKEGNRLFSAFQPEKFMRKLIAEKFEVIAFISPVSVEGLPSQDTWLLRKIA